jgi:hypothetical protein
MPLLGIKAMEPSCTIHPDHHHSAEIKPEGILLVDCGGQYLGGTTDITRTIALSKPDHQQQRHYTLVLKGHIAISPELYILKVPVVPSSTFWPDSFCGNTASTTYTAPGMALAISSTFMRVPHGFAGPGTEKRQDRLFAGHGYFQ